MGESAIGKVGRLVSRVRGAAGPGEVCVLVGGTFETFLAYSDGELPHGCEVLVISPHGSGSFNVVPWPDTTSAITPGQDASGVAGTTER